MTDNSKEYILCAAWKRKEPAYGSDGTDIYLVETGYRHGDIYDRHGSDLSTETGAMGFLTSKCRFVGRKEAMRIAFEAGQVDEATAKYSENLAKALNKIQYVGQKNIPVVPGDWRPLASEDLY